MGCSGLRMPLMVRMTPALIRCAKPCGTVMSCKWWEVGVSFEHTNLLSRVLQIYIPPAQTYLAKELQRGELQQGVVVVHALRHNRRQQTGAVQAG